jgi:hypothetical protein
MLVNNNNPAQQINAAEEVNIKKTISKTDAKVSKLAKGFFASIGACIAAPFKFIARIMKSGFTALINLCKKENKNNPVVEKKSETPSAPAEPVKQVAHQEVQTEAEPVKQVADQEVQAEVETVDQEVQAEAEVVVEGEVENNHEEERFNSFSTFVGTALLGAAFIPMTVNTFTAPYKGDSFVNLSLPMCYPNESLAFGK